MLCRCRVDGEQAVLRAAVNGVFLGCLHVVFGVQSMKNNQTLTTPQKLSTTDFICSHHEQEQQLHHMFPIGGSAFSYCTTHLINWACSQHVNLLEWLKKVHM